MTAQEYRALIDTFIRRELSAEDFAVRYQRALLSENGLERELFLILQDLFEDAEAYDPIWTPEDENGFRITEQTFRREAQDANVKLGRYISAQNKED